LFLYGGMDRGAFYEACRLLIAGPGARRVEQRWQPFESPRALRGADVLERLQSSRR
jgi:hypothetical protein